jgi:hypothetical protein
MGMIPIYDQQQPYYYSDQMPSSILPNSVQKNVIAHRIGAKLQQIRKLLHFDNIPRLISTSISGIWFQNR